MRSESNKSAFNAEALERANRALEEKVARLTRQLESKAQHDSGSQALQLAELIIDNSNAILFRRLASEDPKKRKMVYVSPNISRFGYSAEDFLTGAVMFRDIVYHGDSDRTLKEIQGFVSKNIDTYSQTYRIVTSGGEVRWVEDRTSIFEDSDTGVRYHQGIVIDIHEQKVAENELRRSEEKYRRIVETAGEGFLLMDESFTIVDHNTAYARMVGDPASNLEGKTPLNLNRDEFQQLWSGGKLMDETSECHEIEYEITHSNGHIIPVLIHANTLRSDGNEIIGNMAFVTDMTAQKRALQLAAEVQKGLFPEKIPTVDGLDIAGKSFPCDEVGGDYFDYLNSSNSDEHKEVSIIIGDITGHGVDSALLMASARAFLRMRASQAGTISDIVMEMNRHLTADMESSGRFMTLFYLTIDRTYNRVDWVRAGHDPALCYDPGLDHFEELVGPGMALGVDKDFAYQHQEFSSLKPGQIILLTTDGIVEGCNQNDEMFGKERLKQCVKRYAAESAETILNHIVGEHTRFTGGVAREDDVTIVVVKII